MSAFAFDGTLAFDWLGTFAVHSTLALGGALLASLLLGRRAPALQESLLRASLWLALASATLQCALRGVWRPEIVLSPDAGELLALPVAAPAGGEAVASVAPAPWWADLPWSSVVLAVAATAAFGGLVWLARVHRRLRAVLRARRPETDARVLTAAAEVAKAMGLRQSPHLSRSGAIATPIAFGLVRPEICLPERVGELGPASLRAMLAHEVAHLRAADPAWMWGAAVLQALFPWQLLVVLVRRRWARLVELRCDAIAAEHATPTAVARCLLDVADWLRPGPEATIAALGMAARASALRERVEAALHGAPFRPARRGLATALGGVVLAALTAGAPAVATETRPVDELSAAALLADSVSDEVANRAGRATLVQVAANLSAERTALMFEAEQLRSQLREQPASREQTTMLAAIERRLQGLSRMQARLAGLLARAQSDNR